MQLETKPMETQRGAHDQAPRKFDFDKVGRVGHGMSCNDSVIGSSW